MKHIGIGLIWIAVAMIICFASLDIPELTVVFTAAFITFLIMLCSNR